MFILEYDSSGSTELGTVVLTRMLQVGGFAGSNLQVAQCPKTPSTTITADLVVQSCIAAYLMMHVTPSASGLYMENVWHWTADHDLEDPNLTQITVYTGRGLHIESTVGNIWL
jgi:glucan 1,3-beta-glucosidase